MTECDYFPAEIKRPSRGRSSKILSASRDSWRAFVLGWCWCIAQLLRVEFVFPIWSFFSCCHYFKGKHEKHQPFRSHNALPLTLLTLSQVYSFLSRSIAARSIPRQQKKIIKLHDRRKINPNNKWNFTARPQAWRLSKLQVFANFSTQGEC